MAVSAKSLGRLGALALGFWSGVAVAAPSDDVMQQSLTVAEDQRLSSEPLAPEDAAMTDSWVSADSMTPLERRSRLGGAVGWNFNMPLGSMRDFAANISPIGFEIQLRYWATRRLSFGLSGEWDSFVDERPRSSYQLDNGAVTATAYNQLFSAILRFIPTYYLVEDGPVLPFVAPNIGVAWNEYRSRAADLELTDSKVSIVYGAEAGVLIPTPMDGPMFLFQLRYTAQPASEFRNQTTNAQSLALLAGLAF
jgi:hypothetical protein